jgi:hypothetical protein
MPDQAKTPAPRRRRWRVLPSLVPGLTLACAESAANLPEALPLRTVEDQPVLSLGTALGNPDQELSRVVGAGWVGDSALLVAGAGTHDLRLFDREGALLRSYGREGEGPGENRGLGRIFLRGDSVWTFDVLLKRLDLWSLRDGFQRSHGMPTLAGVPVWSVLGIFDDGGVLAISSPRDRSSAGGSTDSHVDILHWVPDGGAPARLDSLFWGRSFLIVEPGGSSGFPNPFSEGASIVVAGEVFWYTDGRSPTLRKHSAEGDALLTVQLPFEPDPVRSEDREAFAREFLEGIEGRNRQLRQRLVEEAEYPASFPAIADLVAAENGSVWAGRYVRDGEVERTWYVVSGEGEVTSEVTLPADFTLRQVGEEQVVGVRRDGNGVEHVIVYALTDR